MIRIDTKKIEHLESALILMNKKALPYATKHALDATAWDARANAQNLISEEFVTRNRWTRGSIRVEKARVEPIQRQQSAFGTKAPYMRTQEKGGTKTPSRGEHVPIPTSKAAGQARTQRPRTKMVQRPRRMSAIKLRRRYRGPAKVGKQPIVAEINAARAAGDKFVYLEFDTGTKGIFEMRGGAPRDRRGWSPGSRIDMVVDLSRHSVRIPKHRWMRPSADKTRRSNVTLDAYSKALSFQIHRTIKRKYGL